MSDLAEFLRARLDEDEQIARSAYSTAIDGVGRWHHAYARDDLDPTDWLVTCAPLTGVQVAGPGLDKGTAQHIGRWDPARVLAEVAAKRAILDLHVGEHECVGDRHGTLGTVLVAEGYIHELCPTVLALAQPYAEHPEHPDFDPAWRA